MKATDSVVGLILAGGLAKRMGGGDKCLLPLAGKTLLQRAIDRTKPQVQALILNANGNALRFARTRLPIVPDKLEGNLGPLAGIHAGLDWVKRNTHFEWMLCIASDSPFLPVELAQTLLDTAQTTGKHLVIAESQLRLQPVFSLWHISLLDEVSAQLQSGVTPKLQEWVMAQGAEKVSFASTTYDPFFNINTPQDLYTAETTALTLDKIAS